MNNLSKKHLTECFEHIPYAAELQHTLVLTVLRDTPNGGDYIIVFLSFKALQKH